MSTPVHSLTIVRQLPHDRARVFSALTDPLKMAQWFFGVKGGRAKVTNDLRPGGSYRIEMVGGHGTSAPHGTYLEIAPPARLVFTWSSPGCSNVTDTRVTIELSEHEGGTRLTLTHELPAAFVAGHQEGWNICFDHLGLFLAGRPVAVEAGVAPSS